jgi:hypothetical protein
MTLPTTQELADRFVTLLRRDLTPKQWQAMVRDNRTETNPHICHSHDHCDANMVMAEAFEALAGVAPDIDNDDHTALWNAAWDAAMPALREQENRQ